MALRSTTMIALLLFYLAAYSSGLLLVSALLLALHVQRRAPRQ